MQRAQLLKSLPLRLCPTRRAGNVGFHFAVLSLYMDPSLCQQWSQCLEVQVDGSCNLLPEYRMSRL